MEDLLGTYITIVLSLILLVLLFIAFKLNIHLREGIDHKEDDTNPFENDYNADESNL